MNKPGTFAVGQVVIATGSYGYYLTEGKQHTVTKYEPEYPDPDIGFTWPAYVTVIGDFGEPVTGHTYRFRAVDRNQGAGPTGESHETSH